MTGIDHCPFCSKSYGARDVRPDLCHALCRNCLRAVFYSSGLGLLTDCDSEDAARFLRAPKITLHEVLEAYEALEQ